MRALRLAVLACALPFLTSCASKTDSPQKTDNPPGKPAPTPMPTKDALVGKWIIDKDSPRDKRFDWKAFHVHPGESFMLVFRKTGELVMSERGDGSGPLGKYKVLDDGSVELIHETLFFKPGAGKDDKADDKSKIEKLKVKVQISGDELTLSDTAGKEEKYRRKPVMALSVKVTHLPLYSDACVNVLQGQLEKVNGLTELQISAKTKSASFKLKDDEAGPEVVEALDRLGMHGFIEVDGKEMREFSPVGAVLGGGDAPPPKEFTIKNVHACCKECQKALTDVIKSGSVDFEGDGPTRTVKIKGDKLNENEIKLALWRAGFKIEQRR